MKKRFIVTLLPSLILSISAASALEAQTNPHNCFRVVVATNSGSVDGVPNNSTIEDYEYDRTFRYASTFNTLTYGNGSKWWILANAHTGNMRTDFDFTQLHTVTRFGLERGVTDVILHALFWHIPYNFSWKQNLVNQMNSYNTQEVRDYIEYYLLAMAHYMNRREYNLQGLLKKPNVRGIDPLIEAIESAPPYGLRGEAAGSVNRIDSDNGSYWARASVPGQSYFQFIFETARQQFPRAILGYDDYGIIADFDGVEFSRNGVPDTQRFENKAESAFIRAINSPVDAVNAQADFILPANSAEIQAIADQVRRTAARYAAERKMFNLSALSVRIPNSLAYDSAALARQAETYREVIRACVEAPNCHYVTLWDFADPDWWGNHFFTGHGTALPFSGTWNPQLQSLDPKPAYQAIHSYLTTQTIKPLCARQ